MSEYTYEFKPRGDRMASLDDVLAKARAAGTLGIPFTVEHITYEQFRNGGNVTKARCEAYRLTLHKAPIKGV